MFKKYLLTFMCFVVFVPVVSYGMGILSWLYGSSAYHPAVYAAALFLVLMPCIRWGFMVSHSGKFYLSSCLSRKQLYCLEVIPFIIGVLFNAAIVCVVLPFAGPLFHMPKEEAVLSFILFFFCIATGSATYYFQYLFPAWSGWIFLTSACLTLIVYVILAIVFVNVSVFTSGMFIFGIICTGICVLSIVGAYRFKDKVKY